MAWKANINGIGIANANAKTPSPQIIKNPNNAAASNANRRSSKSGSKAPTMQVIAQIEKSREVRRKAAAALIEERKKENLLNEKMGRPGDVDFQRMIKQYRLNNNTNYENHLDNFISNNNKITICVRKRPISKKELKNKDHDSVTCIPKAAAVIVHECKLRVDGITKYLDNNEFVFDHSFDELSTNEDVYKLTVQHLIPFIFDEQGRATVFAYGQTGSGKTFTMEGIQRQAALDLFNYICYYEKKYNVIIKLYVSFFELYGGRCQDLLANQRLTIREDGKGEVQIVGLEEWEISNIEKLMEIIEIGNSKRTTRKTEMNDMSSRSHGICQIHVKNITDTSNPKLHGKLSLIDLAGSERGADTKNHNRQRRMESAEINKSLLALKECFRALESSNNNNNQAHIPFRASQLTQVLKDSFVNTNAKTVMIAAISPCASSADHTVNTLRYADRVKEKPSALNNNSYNKNNDSISEFEECTEDNSVIIDPVDVSVTPSMSPKKQIINSRKNSNRLVKAMDEAIVSTEYNNDNNDKSIINETSPDEYDLDNSMDDVRKLHESLRRNSDDAFDEEAAQSLEEFHGVVQSVYEAQDSILVSHHLCIKENADLLVEEGTMFSNFQGNEKDDYDIDRYVTDLETILDKKISIIDKLRSNINNYRNLCLKEETASKKLANVKYF